MALQNDTYQADGCAVVECNGGDACVEIEEKLHTVKVPIHRRHVKSGYAAVSCFVDQP